MCVSALSFLIFYIFVWFAWCVFSNAYYLKEDSLILSATIDGKRIETIEVSLRTLEVVQSRGVCNKNTAYHEQIVNLVNANRGLISRRMKATA